MTTHIFWTSNDYYPEGCKKLNIAECRNIFGRHGYRLVRTEIGWVLEYDVKGAQICQDYYDPEPITLKSRNFQRKDIQAFAAMILESESEKVEDKP